MTNTLTFYLFIILTLLTLLSIFLNIYFFRYLKKFTKGKNGSSLESIMNEIKKENEDLLSQNDFFKNEIKDIKERLQKTTRNIQTVRYNPFSDQGGNQSFSTALINDEGDGVVISGLYSRERMSVFAKPIKKMKSEYELTEEEVEVLKKSN